MLSVIHSVTTEAFSWPEWGEAWVVAYTLSYTLDDSATWLQVLDPSTSPPASELLLFEANYDLDTVIVNELPEPLVARYLKLHPVSWNRHIALQWRVKGCLVGKKLRKLGSQQ